MIRTRLLAVAAAGTLMVALGGVGAASAGDGLGVSGTALEPDQIGYSKNIKHLSNTPHVGPFAGQFGTDLAFQDDRAYVGNYQGFIIFDISEPAAPVTLAQVNCPGSQNDITVAATWSTSPPTPPAPTTAARARTQSVNNPASWEGIKIFDVSDPTSPKYIKSVETKCGSHTHTLVPGDDADYLYVSSYGPSAASADCKPPHDLISIVKVPHADPTSASVVATPVLFPGAAATTQRPPAATTSPPTRARTSPPARAWVTASSWTSPTPRPPKVIETVRDTTNFAFWHSATFNNKGDQGRVHRRARWRWRGDVQRHRRADPRCQRDLRPLQRQRADLQVVLQDPAPPGRHRELRRSQRLDRPARRPRRHGAVLVPGRRLPLGLHRLGNPRSSTTSSAVPLRRRRSSSGGTWSAYYYNGFVYSSDIQKGFDVLMLKDPTLRKANSVRLSEFNAQSQPVYPTR